MEDPTAPASSHENPLAKLRARLKRLHRHAGEPSTRQISRLTSNAISHTTVSLVLRCEKLPRWEQLERVVEALKGNTDEFRSLWIIVRDTIDGLEPTVSMPTHDQDTTVEVPGLGAEDDDLHRQYDESSVLARLSQLNVTGAWEKYADPDARRFKFARYHMLFRLKDRVGIECITYRVLQALSDGVDSYRSVAWYYSDPEANVEIVPLANCEVAALQPLAAGGAAALLKLPHALRQDETCFFASKVIYHSKRESTRIVSHEVRSRAVDELTIGIQFDQRTPPSFVWHYSSNAEIGMKRPDKGSSDLLSVSEAGYTSHVFLNCANGRRYGIQWDW